MLGTKMGYPIGVPLWVLKNAMFIKIIGKADKVY